jgi:hypothetical protein
MLVEHYGFIFAFALGCTCRVGKNAQMLAFLTTLACVPAADPQANLAQIISAPGADATFDFTRCRALPARDVGQCGEFVAIHHTRVGNLAPGSLCPQVEGEPWRSECFFEEAEHARKSGQDALAMELCAESGEFAEHCHLHLWSRDARAVIGQRPPDALGPRLPRLEAIHDRWLPHADDAFSPRFWSYTWSHAHRSMNPLSFEDCATLSTPHRGRCEHGALVELGQRLAARAASPRGLADLCALDPATVDQLGRTMPGTQAVDTEENGPFQAVLDEARADRCSPTPGSR